MKLRPKMARFLRVGDLDGAAVEQDRACVGLDDAGQAADQRGLAGAVGADQAMHLAGDDVEVDALERLYAAKVLDQRLNLQKWLLG